MPRMTASKSLELESFWRAHLEGWRRSDLNQREYCELQGLPLKRFGNWRAKLRHEEPALAGKLLYRRGGGLSHMTSHMAKEIVSPPSGYLPSARSAPPGSRRRFATAKFNGIEPYAHLKNVLERMTHGYPANRIDDLLSWNWIASNVET